jgi:AraC-like DNA-binding protein
MKPTVKDKLGDPSTVKQDFINVKLNILCCRYWLLNVWDCYDMAFPFWRIYWNRNSGGKLTHMDNVFEMLPDCLYIIPPFTSFSSKYEKEHIYPDGVHVSGRHLVLSDDEDELEERCLIHLFIHFNLGVPFDNVLPGIFEIKLSDFFKDSINYITSSLKSEKNDFDLTFTLKLQALIKESLSNIGTELWKTINIDARVLKVIRTIEASVDKKFNNAELANLIFMAPNSFARLFKEQINVTLHNFIQKRKIAQACELFEHTNKTIEDVAYHLGFSDRYHFSRVFKSVTGITPANYKMSKYSKRNILL